MSIVVGSVPYVNAKPLIAGLAGDPEVEVKLAVPSKLPAMLDAHQADVVLVSSFEALRTPGRTVVGGVSISSLDAAESVRLFSRVPLNQIQNLALDQSSLTSNNLARILLAELYGVRPTCELAAPNLDDMLKRSDAAVLIGDIGMTTQSNDLHVLDLGSAWHAWTGLPFVWALWVGREDLPYEAAHRLFESKEWGIEHLEMVIEQTIQTSGWDPEICRRYLTHTMNYDLSERHLAGLDRYRERLISNGLLESAPLPRVLGPTLVSA